jgi:hypothetical protein
MGGSKPPRLGRLQHVLMFGDMQMHDALSEIRVRATTPKKEAVNDKDVSWDPVVPGRSSVAMLQAHRYPVSEILQKRHYEKSHRS